MALPMSHILQGVESRVRAYTDKHPFILLDALYIVIGEIIRGLVPEISVHQAMLRYCEVHGMDVPWDNDLKSLPGGRHGAIGQIIWCKFRMTEDDTYNTFWISGAIISVHAFRGILVNFPDGPILVSQIDEWIPDTEWVAQQITDDLEMTEDITDWIAHDSFL
jgi:hypothetical protein